MSQETATINKSKTKIQEPNEWRVVLVNDDVTPMDFVVAILMGIFNHDIDSANEIMMAVHNTGSGIAGIYTHDIAETKAAEATMIAEENDFPLVVKIEEIL